MFRQRQYILRPLPQRRQLDLHHIQSVKKILPKRFRLHHRRQIFIRGGNHSDLRAQGLVTTQSLKFPVLQNSQKFRLQGQRHVPDLVQKDGSTIRPFKLSDSLRQRPSESPPLMPEQLTLQQSIGNGRTVDRHIRTRRPWAVRINGPGDQLLTGSAFTHQKNRRIRPRHLPDHFVDFLHRRGCPDQSRSEVFLLCHFHSFSGSQLFHRGRRLQPSAQNRKQLRYIKRLQNVIKSPQFHGLDRRLRRAVRRHNNHQLPRMLFP